MTSLSSPTSICWEPPWWSVSGSIDTPSMKMQSDAYGCSGADSLGSVNVRPVSVGCHSGSWTPHGV